MTLLVSLIGLAALLAALAGTVLLDLARETAPESAQEAGEGEREEPGRRGGLLVAIAADGRAVRILVLGLVLLGAAGTVVRLGRLA
jgi:hypothetical protein